MRSSDAPAFIPISRKFLLLIYIVIPIALIIALFDMTVLGGRLSAATPKDPHEYALFTLLFTLPHIISSFFGFFDKEYIKEYGHRLLRGAQIVALVSILLPVISLDLAFLVFAAYTMIHVFRQQSGISKSLGRGANRFHTYWEWTGILLSLFLYVAVYSTASVPPIFYYSWVALIVPYTIFAFLAVRSSKTHIGTTYFWLTHSMPIISGLLYMMGYPIFTIALPRMVHDLTAYCFYATHDHNRYLDAQQNYLYRLTSMVHIPVLLANPILSVGVAALLQSVSSGSTYITLMFLFLFHYYTDSFVWKSGSLHRKYILIK